MSAMYGATLGSPAKPRMTELPRARPLFTTSANGSNGKGRSISDGANVLPRPSEPWQWLQVPL